MHNLITMSQNQHQVGTDIINELGLTTATRWPANANPAQGSKNYYGVTNAGAAQAQLYGVVVTSVWQGDGMLGYSATGFKRYTMRSRASGNTNDSTLTRNKGLLVSPL